MPDYTIFIFNKENQITGIKLAAGLTVDGVLAKAAEMVNDQHGVEVWNLARLVATLAPNETSAPAPTGSVGAALNGHPSCSGEP